jgi:hypothetical protein
VRGGVVVEFKGGVAVAVENEGVERRLGIPPTVL